MPNSMDIEPAVLRQLANQHDQVAADTREWAKPPTAWLNSFIDTYGKIAQPVYDALVRYYGARERAGNALAREHDDTATALRASADAYEQSDADFGSQIRMAGDPDAAGHVPMSPAPNGATPPVTALAQSGGPSPVQTAPDGVAPGGPNGAGPTGMPPVGTTPVAETPTTGTPTAGVTAPSGAAPPSSSAPGAPLGPIYGPADDRSSAAPPTGPARQADATPIPIPPTPFAAAVSAAKEKEAEPAYVLGDAVNADLVLARTLLSAVLAAVDSSVVGLNWAVSVMRGPAGAGVFITSNEGRGWMPAGLFLPREVSTPWLWDELLGPDSEGSGSPWEGISDPARVLVEFGLAWGPKANAQLSALVSSGPIDTALRAQLSEVAMEGLVAPSADVDLRIFTPDTTDRLGLVGTTAALEHVASVPDARVRARTIELAVDAHLQVARSGQSPVEAASLPALRDRIVAMVEVGREVPPEWWDELRDADDLLAAEMLSRRVEVGRVGLGELRADNEVAALRAMVFQRRCNELVSLLAGEPTRQSLRDAVYAHEQILKHPLFVEVPAAVSTPNVERAAGPATATSSISAPSVTAGPPRGAVIAPTSPPPVAPPDDERRRGGQ